MEAKKIYQLNDEQLNVISSDLIEAIILISGKKDKQGILEVLNNYAKDIKENIIPDFRSIITTARSINYKQKSVVLAFENLDNKVDEKHQNFCHLNPDVCFAILCNGGRRDVDDPEHQCRSTKEDASSRFKACP